MIITCPNCRTRYQINPASLGERGRKVRCSSCGHRWLVEPFVETAAAAPPPPIPPSPPTPPPTRPPEPEEPTPLAAPGIPTAAGPATAERRGNGLVGWLLLALIVLLLIAAVLGRNDIATAFPAALPVYERLGLPVTLRLGLELDDLASSRHEERPGESTVVISGTIRNATTREVRVPKLRVALLDGGRKEIESSLFDPPQPVLPPEGSARFELSLANPPEAARDFTITFTDRP